MRKVGHVEKPALKNSHSNGAHNNRLGSRKRMLALTPQLYYPLPEPARSLQAKSGGAWRCKQRVAPFLRLQVVIRAKPPTQPAS